MVELEAIRVAELQKKEQADKILFEEFMKDYLAEMAKEEKPK